MKLIDFLQDSQLNLLRRQMGTDDYGNFQLFDPQRQLTYAEREALEQGELHISASLTRALRDKTLALKNSRIWLLMTTHCTWRIAIRCSTFATWAKPCAAAPMTGRTVSCVSIAWHC